MGMLEPTSTANFAALFQFKERPRVGWMLQLPNAPQPSPERDHPPAIRNVGLPVYLRTAAQWNKIMLPFAFAAGLAWIFSLVSLKWTGQTLYAVLALFVWPPVGCVVMWRWAREGTLKWARVPAIAKQWQFWVMEVLTALACVFLPFLSLVIVAVLAFVRAWPGNSPPLLDPNWEAAQKAAAAEHALAWQAWQQRVMQFEAADQQRFATAKAWYPVEVRGAAEVICFCGGYASSWELLLSTMGSSLLGSGRRVTVLNLTRHLPAAGLAWLAGRNGRVVEQIRLPGERPITDFLGGMDYATLTDVLTDTLHGRAPVTDEARWARQEDRAVLRDVAEKLGPSRPVTIGRLRAALRVVLAEEDRPGGEDAVLGADEFDALRRLYRESLRTHGGVLERVARLDRLVRELVILDPPKDVAPPAARLSKEANLRILEVTGVMDQLDSQLAGEVVFNMVAQAIRRQTLRTEVLIIAGADRLSARVLKALHEDCAQAGTAIILLFQDLGDSAAEMLGKGGAVAGFMALGNAREAAEAVQFIGQGHFWRENQVTRTVSDSLNLSHGTGTQNSSSVGEARTWGHESFFPSTSRSVTQTFTEMENSATAYGRTDAMGISMQQVKDVLVEPHVMQGLPATGMIFVEILPGGERRISSVDFDPRIASLPLASADPYRA